MTKRPTTRIAPPARAAFLTLARAALAGVGLLAVLPGAVPAAPAEGPEPGVVACDSLVGLRQLMARAGEDRAAVPVHLAGAPGCRTVPRARLGAVERRAMVGGAPYECLTAEGACLWVLP
ncbi:hypothetical protein [Methylobacterium nigriterrae]|uniref:hypothetical protein n=1 Tax=Methylobacterium nigriterrae TaxID=3127512 RepID=UPI003013FF5A